MMKYFTLSLLTIVFLSCGEESKEKKDDTPKENQEEAQIQNSDQRITAVQINNQLSLSQAEAYILIDSLMSMEDLEAATKLIPEIQIEIVDIQKRVEDLDANLEGGQAFKQAVLDQISFIDSGLKSDIPAMFEIANSKKEKAKEIADKMYFNWINKYQEMSHVIIDAQMRFAQKHNIKMN